MSKTNDIKKAVLKHAFNNLEQITNIIYNCHVIEPTNIKEEMTSFLRDPNEYIAYRKKSNKKMPGYVDIAVRNSAKILGKLNRIYNLRNLFIETTFLHDFINLNQFNPILYRSFKQGNFINYKDEEIFVPEFIVNKLIGQMHAENFQFDKYIELFDLIETPKYKAENIIYNSKLADRINLLSNKRIIKRD